MGLSNEEFDKKLTERFNNLNLKEGDLIFTNVSGIHEVVRIERRILANHPELQRYYDKSIIEELAPLIHYRKVYTNEFKPKKEKRIRTCSVFFISRFDAGYRAVRDELVAKIYRLDDIYYGRKVGD